MEIKTSELTDAALDWAVAKCEGYTGITIWSNTGTVTTRFANGVTYSHSYSTEWAQGGPIIEREGISLTQSNEYPQWTAEHPLSDAYDGPTPLIAAMRCYVASKMGDKVGVPDELIKD